MPVVVETDTMICDVPDAGKNDGKSPMVMIGNAIGPVTVAVMREPRSKTRSAFNEIPAEVGFRRTDTSWPTIRSVSYTHLPKHPEETHDE